MSGRPRSEEARRAVLAAATRSIEHDGYGSLTMEGIAREAGVSKQTIYRWWPRKADIVLEALTEGAAALAPAPATGALATDVREFVLRSVAGASPRRARLLTALMAEAQIDPDFAKSFRRGFLAQRRGVLQAILDDARERGDLAADVDTGFVAELVYGLIWYRMLSASGPLNRRFGEQVADAVIKLIRAA